MNRAMFSGVAGLKAHQTKMDVIGNNIANVNTYGYKAQHAVFSDVFYQTLKGATTTTAAATVGYGSKLAAIRSDMGSSSLQSTGNSMDVAITGEGFFQVKNGDTTYYTKAGEFGFDPSTGNVVDVNGNVVQGFATSSATTVAPLKLLNNAPTTMTGTTEAQLSTLKGISIGSDGSLNVTAPDGSTYVAGYVALANFANPSGLQAAGSSYYEASADSGTATSCKPGDSGTGELQSSTLEMSNVDLASEFADMITTERGFQANSRIISVSDTMLEELINLKR